MSKVHIHEDDEGMRNVYPAGNAKAVEDDIKAAAKSARDNQSEDGIGWTDIHVIQTPEHSFRDVGLTMRPVAEAVAAHLPRIKEFEVGFGDGNPFRYKDEEAFCFGFAPHLYLKLDVDGDQLTAIWFDVQSDNEDELARLRQALQAIDALHLSMIADYWFNTYGLISDPSFMDRYVEALKG